MIPTGSNPDPPALAACARLVVVMPTWVGDTVMATPSLRALRLALPKTEIVGLMRPEFVDLLRGTTFCDRLEPSDHRGLLAPIASARTIRALQPDAVLLLPNSFRWGLAAWLSRAAIRVGYARDGRGVLLTHAPTSDRRAVISTRDHYLRLVGKVVALESVDSSLELGVTAAQRSAADEVLGDVHGAFALLVPGGNRPDKRWPAERFAQLADAIREAHGFTIVATGSPGERDIIAAITAAAKAPIIDLSRRPLTLGSLKAVIERAALVVTNDTGPRHIAAALRRPLVTLFGPTDHRWTTIDCPTEAILLAEPFLTDRDVADRHPERCRINRIAVGDVLAAVAQVLGRT